MIRQSIEAIAERERQAWTDEAELLLTRLNLACDEIEPADSDGEDHVGLIEFQWLRKNVVVVPAMPISCEHGPGYCMPCNHMGPDPAKWFISANLDDEQFRQVQAALAVARGGTAEESLTTICREWLAARRSRGCVRRS